jgi:ATP-binding cassette, subfamily B (MDR/TAP), member 1
VKALDGLNLSIPQGKFTALVGTSGGGKSTLVSLLSGNYDYSGSIKIGDQELRKIDASCLRSQIAVVEQDHILFSGSIYDNVCHGVRNLQLSAKELERRCAHALKEANADFIDNLADGVHTRLGDGLQLSGGQMCAAEPKI